MRQELPIFLLSVSLATNVNPTSVLVRYSHFLEKNEFLQFCSSNCFLSIPDSSLPSNIQKAMRNQEVAFTLWFYYNQPLPSSDETFL